MIALLEVAQAVTRADPGSDGLSDADGLLHGFDLFEVDPTAFHDAGETVIVQGRYRGRTARSGHQLDAPVCHVWTIREGKLAAFQQYTDTWQFAQVTTAAPTP